MSSLLLPGCAPVGVAGTEGLSKEAVEIVDLLLRIGHRLRGVLAAHFAEFDLTDIRYAVLQAIRRSAGDCSQTELADELGQSESSISTLIERMRGDDLLYRLRSQNDRRKWVLMLTPRGRAVLELVDQCHDRRMAALLRGLDAQQQRTLAELLRGLLARLSRADAELVFERHHVLPQVATPPAA